MKDILKHVKKCIIDLSETNFFSKKVLLFVSLILVIVLISIIPLSFAVLQPVKSVEVFSEKLNYQNSEPGAWKVMKSARWINSKEAEVTIDVDTLVNRKTEYTDILIVLDTSSCMNKFWHVKSVMPTLLDKLLSNGKNRVALITFDSNYEVISGFTNDKEDLVNKVDALTLKGFSSYYEALKGVDSLMSSYEKKDNRDCVVLFLAGTLPNKDMPNEVGEYNYLKKQYSFLKINGVLYTSSGDTYLEYLNNVTDRANSAEYENFNDVLYEATLNSLEYDKFIIEDFINTDYFVINDLKDIKVNKGVINLDTNNNKITWELNDLSSGAKGQMKIKVSLKAQASSSDELYSISKDPMVINSIINGVVDTVSREESPILKDNYKVIYNANTPANCTSNKIEDRVYSVLSTVEISDTVFKCDGYQFRGWDIVNKDVTLINSDYFLMPEENVEIRGVWSKITVTKKHEGNIYEAPPSIIQKVENQNYNEKLWNYREQIAKVIFEPKIDVPTKAVSSWDISESGDGMVMAYIVPNEENSNMYTAHIQGVGEIYANENSGFIFAGFTNLKVIEGFQYFNTSQARSMRLMFLNCTSLLNLDLSSFDTRNVTDMYGVFYCCKSLINLNLTGLNTSNVTEMYCLFYLCEKLTTIDISSFDTRNVVNMFGLFSSCSNLTSIDVSGLNTSKVRNMHSMFASCVKLKEINVSNFDTRNVVDMVYMFSDCASLTYIDVTNFNTSKVTDMRYMFLRCTNLKELNLSNFDTSNVTEIYCMFQECTNLRNLYLGTFDMSKVVTMQYMFLKCSNLITTITIRNPNITQYWNVFDSAATSAGAKIVVNYTTATASLVDKIIATKSSNSNVVKGVLV